LLPENTLPSFEAALDAGVGSIETDVHLTRDGVPALFHDARLTDRLCVPCPAGKPLVRDLTLAELRGVRIGSAAATPVAAAFAAWRGIYPYGIPTVAEFFDFVAAYAGRPGEEAGKTKEQREGASRLVFDLELKRVPFEPATIGDGFNGTAPGLLERLVVAAIREAGVLQRARVRSFDHRSVRAVKQLEPTLPTGVLLHATVPCDIAGLMAAAQADFFCPDFLFVDAEVVRAVHTANKRLIPYTVNDPAAWQRLTAWGVDGITTDYPDRLRDWLSKRPEG
jgi:glycerophosphoryl diester phosphodiesterase